MSAIQVVTERRVTIFVFAIAIALFGLVSLSKLRINLLPDLSYPTLTVRTELTGAAPEEIEALLSKPIEDAVGVINNVRQVRSVSRSEQSDVIIEFVWGTAMETASVEVREKIDVLELPLEASRPILLRFDPSSEPILRFMLAEAEEPREDGQTELDAVGPDDMLRMLRRLAEDEIEPRLESQEGTAAVKVSGGLEDEIQVTLDQGLLAQLGLDANQVAARLAAENVNLAGGRLEQGLERFLVRTLNEFKTVDQLANSIVARIGDRPVRLEEVGTAERAYKDRVAITRVNGREGIEIAVYREGDANTVLVADRVRKEAERLEERLPKNVSLTIVGDQSTFIAAAISQVRTAAVVGGILAVLMLYAFLGDARSTAIVAVAIPVSVVGTFLAMYASDLTLNIMSLGGIALAIGLLVDNSIVVLENIFRHRERGKSNLIAAQDGTREVASAVVAATLTTVAVFLPMVFVSGIAGELFRDQALTVTFALLFSLLVALGLIPMLAGISKGTVASTADTRSAGWFTRTVALVATVTARAWHAAGQGVRLVMSPIRISVVVALRGLRHAYLPLLRFSLHNRTLVLAVALGVSAASALLIPRLGTELMPELTQGEMILSVRAVPGTPLAETDRLIAAVESQARVLDDVALTYAVAGTGNRLDANPVDSGEHTGQIVIKVNPASGREGEQRILSALRGSLRERAGVATEFSRPELFALAAPLVVEVAGYDLSTIENVAEQINGLMLASERFTDIRTTVQPGSPEIRIVFDQERAAQIGMPVRDIADQVVTAIRGNVATRYTWRDKEIDVLVRTVDRQTASIDKLSNLIINPASERPVTLSSVATLTVDRGPSEIRRVDQSRVAQISASVAFGDLGSAARELDQIIARIPMPREISVQVGGQNKDMEESLASLQLALAMAIFLVYLVMASQFESLIQPFVILFTIPLALVGTIMALFVTGTTINVVALIGVIMLAGIVVNNAIVLVDLINQLREGGKEITEAVIEACETRLRPILMTTSTTILGLAPMALGFGEGAEIRAPMAISVIGGLLSSTLLTLVVIPVVYSLFVRDRQNLVPAAEAAE